MKQTADFMRRKRNHPEFDKSEPEFLISVMDRHPATEFDIQGLELDWTIVAWDADLQFEQGTWAFRNFSGSTWQNVKDEQRRRYLKNAYRVLLTRARQGMVIFVPHGDDEDKTRQRDFYDGTFGYLEQIGLEVI